MNQEFFQDEYEYNEKDFQNNFQDLLDSEDEEEENLYEEENKFLNILESINQETLERYAMYFMLTYTADEYKNDDTLNNIKNELVNIILNKEEYLKIYTFMSFTFNENAFIKQISHLKYLITSLQNEKIKDFEEWLKTERKDKEEFENFTKIVYDFIESCNEPFVNYCHLDIYSYRFRRRLLIYILNTSNYALMSKLIHTYDQYHIKSLTEEQQQKISRYITISNQINQILFKSKICKDIVQYHLNPMINPKIEDMYNYTNWKDLEDAHYYEIGDESGPED